jgi:hypothetical protein
MVLGRFGEKAEAAMRSGLGVLAAVAVAAGPTMGGLARPAGAATGATV